jgi:hypothetical protein
MAGVESRVRKAEEAPNALQCERCGGTGDVFLRGKSGGVCLDCAGLGHLEFLPACSAPLTRRAVKMSKQPVIVMRWTVRRFRGGGYERQGVLAEPAVIERAARESLSDADVPGRDEIAAAIREEFPGCPAERAEAIALYTAVRVRGRGRRRPAAQDVEPETVRSAVAASVLHVDTEYDDLVMSGVDRESARARVLDRVEEVLTAWREGVTVLDDA